MIPKFKDYFYPFLFVIRDGKEYSVETIKSGVAQFLKLSKEDLSRKTKGGRGQHDDRIKWTITYLKGLRLIESNRRGFWKISVKGTESLAEYGESLTLNTLRDMKGYKEVVKTDSTKGHWVPGHHRYDGTYVAGYYSNFFAKGIRKSRVLNNSAQEDCKE